MPIMNDLRNKLQQQGIDFEVLAVNVDSDPEDGIDFLLDAPVDFVVLSDPAGGTPALYGVKGMPTSYLVDQQGNIVMKHEGFKRRDVDMIEARILALAGQGN
jgi:peroxiredoxin